MYSFMEIKNETFTDFYMLYCGLEQCSPLYAFGPAIRPNYLLHYCYRGKGSYYAKNKTYDIRAGDAFLICPNEVTFYQADAQDPWYYLWIGFGGSNVETYLKHCGLSHDQLICHCDEKEILYTYIHDMLTHHTLSYANELHIQGTLFLFFSVLSKAAKQPYASSISSENLYINKAIEYIQNNYQNMITVSQIATYISLNRSYLSLLFQKYIHMSPQQFLMKFRITKAKEMLTESTFTISQIAYSCGYSNQLAFSKAFRKITGTSPSHYRKEHLNCTNNIKTSCD